MDLSFDSVDSVYESSDRTYDLTDLQCEPTSRECDLTDYNTYVSTASVCEQTETFNPVDSVYQSMDCTYGLTGLQCEPTSFSHTPTDSEHNWKDFDSYVPTEEPFEQTEGKAWRLLAARIPPELFDDIMFYVNVHRVSQRQHFYRDGAPLARNQGKPSPGDFLTDLKQCSLVCLFWANRCREHMFAGRPLEIRSYEDAETFRRYIVQGCPRLTQVHQLISCIRVYQLYRSGSSFLHFLYIPVIRDKLERIYIEGPVTAGFNPAKLDTPHWGVPPSILTPDTFLNTNIIIDHVHLPSFVHVAKYIKHFVCAEYMGFTGITWDGQTDLSLPHASNTIPCRRRPRSLEIMARESCTNTVHLALTALMMNPNCPLHRLSEEECVWMNKFMTLLWGDKEYPLVYIGFDVSEQATTMELDPFYFVFEEATAFTDRSAPALSVVGMHAYIHYASDDLPANFDALVNHARTQPTIRALVLLFDSFSRLQQYMKPLVHLLGPGTEALDLILAYEEEEEKAREKSGRVLGVDPVTLEPSGRTWADVSKYVSRSNAILRRELKKRR